MPYRLIDPQETLDYACDWSAFLADGSPADSITGSSWSIAPAGPTLSQAQQGGALTRVFVSGCSAGAVHRLSNRITTAQGRTAERSITLRCENR